jgi:hypothetical protein
LLFFFLCVLSVAAVATFSACFAACMVSWRLLDLLSSSSSLVIVVGGVTAPVTLVSRGGFREGGFAVVLLQSLPGVIVLALGVVPGSWFLRLVFRVVQLADVIAFGDRSRVAAPRALPGRWSSASFFVVLVKADVEMALLFILGLRIGACVFYSRGSCSDVGVAVRSIRVLGLLMAVVFRCVAVAVAVVRCGVLIATTVVVVVVNVVLCSILIATAVVVVVIVVVVMNVAVIVVAVVLCCVACLSKLASAI